MGDVADNTVKCFNAKTGAFEQTLVSSNSGGLVFPVGLLFRNQGDLLVVSQNVGTPFAGDLLKYDSEGDSEGALVPHTSPKAPYGPRGIVQRNGLLYVADMGDPDYVLAGGPAPNPFPAQLEVFNANTGAFVRNLAYAGFAETCTSGADPVCEQWSPRAVVFGPYGALYVSLMHFVSGENPNLLPGRVIRFAEDGVASVFADGEDCDCGLARPEGLVWGPGNRLYVTSFRLGETDNDKILVFDKGGKFIDQIDLDQVGQPRAFAQGIIFGPQNKLFVPISGNGPDTGSVRAYNVHSKKYDVLVAAGGELLAPFYPIFGKSNPATLNYDD